MVRTGTSAAPYSAPFDPEDVKARLPRGFAFSEINQRGFYKRWREMMLLDTWDELRPGLRSSGDR